MGQSIKFSRRAYTTQLRVTRPKELTREFIHDCLYNPKTGYFNKLVNIFDAGRQPIDFTRLNDQEDYARELHKLYKKQSRADEEYYQLWHTPSELFKPWYGQGIARHMMDMFGKFKQDELVIYEVGPGNGSLAKNILDYIKDTDNALYKRTTYNLVEISTLLLAHQKNRLVDHQGTVKFHRCSATEINHRDRRHVFVMAMEVLDNMPHDRIAYDRDGQLKTAYVCTNDEASMVSAPPGRFWEEWEPATDPLILEYIQMMDRVGYMSPSLKWHPLSLLDPVMNSRNPWRTEFIPTVAYQFLKQIAIQFPKHHLILSDFVKLPDAVKGHCGPVVQTRYKGDTVSCSTHLLERGLFDIFFPTNFNLLRLVHEQLSGRAGKVFLHGALCHTLADHPKTRTRTGYNPMLEEFKNVQFYLS